VTSDCISVSLVNPVISHIKSLGFDVKSAIRDAQIDARVFADPDNRIPAAKVDALFNILATLSGKEDIGLSAGASLEARSYNLLQHLLLCCSTLSEALVYLNRYYILFSDEAPPIFSRKGDGSVKITFPINQDTSEQNQIRFDLILTITCQWLPNMWSRIQANPTFITIQCAQL